MFCLFYPCHWLEVNTLKDVINFIYKAITITICLTCTLIKFLPVDSSWKSFLATPTPRWAPTKNAASGDSLFLDWLSEMSAKKTSVSVAVQCNVLLKLKKAETTGVCSFGYCLKCHARPISIVRLHRLICRLIDGFVRFWKRGLSVRGT